MRNLAISMAVTALLCAPLGCNKNSDQPRSPATTTPTTTTTTTPTTTSEPSMTPAAGQLDFGSGDESDMGSDTSGTWGSDTSEPSVDPGATPELRGGDAGVQDDTQSPDEGTGDTPTY